MDLENARYFEWLHITREDSERTESYRAREEIQEKLNTSLDLDAYLESLHMVGMMKPLDGESITRAVQLLNKISGDIVDNKCIRLVFLSKGRKMIQHNWILSFL